MYAEECGYSGKLSLVIQRATGIQPFAPWMGVRKHIIPVALPVIPDPQPRFSHPIAIIYPQGESNWGQHCGSLWCNQASESINTFIYHLSHCSWAYVTGSWKLKVILSANPHLVRLLVLLSSLLFLFFTHKSQSLFQLTLSTPLTFPSSPLCPFCLFLSLLPFFLPVLPTSISQILLSVAMTKD